VEKLLSFSVALKALKDGFKVSREGWNGKGMFIFLSPGSVFKVDRQPMLSVFPEGTTINYAPHIDIKAADDTVAPWLPSQADLLAEDWSIIN
jgi:hypothetical protein